LPVLPVPLPLMLRFPRSVAAIMHPCAGAESGSPVGRLTPR
jgi:hypothetical protein